MRQFIIVVDTQYDFMAPDGALSVAGADALARPMQDWLDARDAADTAGILFTFDTHVPEIYAGSPESAAFPIHCVRDSTGWKNMLDPAGIDPAVPVLRLEKGVFDMWAEPDLTIDDWRGAAAPEDRDAFFTALEAQGVSHATVIGVAADYCVRWAVDGLLDRGFAVTVPARLTRGIDRQIETVAEQDFAGKTLTII